MTAIAARVPSPAAESVGRAWIDSARMLCGLAAIVAIRFVATRAGMDSLAVGLAFGTGLALLAGLGGARTGRALVFRTVRAAVAGALIGVVLVGVGLVGPALGGLAHLPGLARPAAPLAPWAAITVLVAFAEEAVLRGVLFDRVRRGGGTLAAVVVTTIAFALLHVPQYGWHVVPLDLAVGLTLGGLRMAAGTVAAPAVAHAVADLATWWL
jgi:membrane protease YdiL (CAAX protease family)